MFRKYILPLIAIAGIFFGIFMVYFSAKKPPIVKVLFPPPVSPYKHYLAGSGIIESINKNIYIGTSFDEVVTDIYVKRGDIVKKGAPLFKLDTQTLEAQLIQATQDQHAAEIDYKNQTIQFSFYEKLKEKSAVSKQQYEAAFYNKHLAKTRLDAAIAAVNVIKINIEKSTSYAPIDGEILQVNIRVGQALNRFGAAASTASSATEKMPMVFGDTSFYHLRIDIDEEDAWRYAPGSSATAFVRGNADLFIPLEFVYLEPYMGPKSSLNGLGTERVDTRVLQVVYRFSKPKFPIYVGQQLDVFLEGKPNGEHT